MSADYGDEFGRRKMFSLVRDMVSTTLFPHALLDGALDVLLKLSAGQRDFMQIVVELVQEMSDWEREGERDEQSEEEEEDDEAEVEDTVSRTAL
jgi:condensin complex subunit 3